MPDRSIHKLVAIGLLLLFSMASIPRVYFHEAIVHHRDIGACQYPNKELAHIHQQGYSCPIDQLVVDAPFVQPFLSHVLTQPLPELPAYTDLLTHGYRVYGTNFKSRGPPVLILCV